MRIHSITIDASMIPDHISNKERIKYHTGAYIYFLIYNDIPIYVGSSKQVILRLYLHKKYVKFNKAVILDFFEQDIWDELCKMEQYYIDRLNPPLQRKLTWYEREYCILETPINYEFILSEYQKRDFNAAR